MTMSEKVEHTRLECFEHTQTRSSERPQYLDAHMKAQSEAGWKLVSTASNGDKRNTWVSLYWQRPVDLSRLLADRDRLREALNKIIRPHGCGCKPCTGQCESDETAKIWKEETIEIARTALKDSNQ